MSASLAGTALILGGSFTGSVLVKATAIAAITLLAAWLARRHRASVRHVILATGFASLLALPVVIALADRISIDVPVSVSVPALAVVEPWDAIYMTNPSTAPAAGGSTSSRVDLNLLLMTVWLAGVLVSLAPVIAGMVQLARYRRYGMPAGREQAQLLREYASASGVGAHVTLLRHESVSGPLTYGVLRPVVFLPLDSKAWGPKALLSAMVHELEHIRRADWFVHCASRLICALYWFHPLVWVMWRRLALEAERACDDAVLRQTEATRYAEQLVEVAERLSARRQSPLLAMAGRDELSARVAALLDSSLPRGRAGVAGVAVAAAVMVMVALIAPLRAVGVTLPSASTVAPSDSQVPAPPPSILAFTAGAPPNAVAVAQGDSSQAQAQRPAFEAASIRVNSLGGPIGQVNVNLPGGRVIARNTRLRLVIAAAYQPGFAPRRSLASMIGLPDWDESLAFDVEAVASGNPSLAEKRLMLQSMLAERFNLALHPETRQGPVFDLVVDGRPGSQLTPHSPSSQCAEASAPPAPPTNTVPAPPPLPPPCGGIRVQAAYWGGSMTTRMSGNGVTLQAIAERLTWFQDVDRVVIDKTGLAGSFDFVVEWTPTVQLPPPDGADPTGLPVSDKPGQFTALREQLGLRLQPATGPIEVLVVDRVDKPTDN